MPNNDSADDSKNEDKFSYAHPEDEAKIRRKEIEETIEWQQHLTQNGYPIGYF